VIEMPISRPDGEVPTGQADKSAIERVVARIRGVYSKWNRNTPIAEMRRDWDAMFATESAAAAPAQPVEVGEMDAEWIGAPAKSDGVILYLHGGGFQVGSIASYRGFIARLCKASGCRALAINYRLAPEHKFPAAVNDAAAAYEWLIAQGVQPFKIAFVGDSAGGGLAISAMYLCRERGTPLPAAAVLLSPWTDLAATGDSFVTRAALDPIHQKPMILAMAHRYLGEMTEARNPLASPLYGSLAGLPPLLIHVGSRETIFDDSSRLAEAAEKAGTNVTFQVWEGMTHVFQMYPDDLPEARQAIAAIGHFVLGHIN
jgi:acetyl esterase/lipase